MRSEDRVLAKDVASRLRKYSKKVRALPGLEAQLSLDAFVFQMIESVRRVRFVKEVGKRGISPQRKDPASELFDPIRAAILEFREENFEEACWLVFLFTHFGKNVRSEYRLLRDVYGGLGTKRWTWKRISNDPFSFRQWLDANLTELRSGTVHRAFGNHRKYQSLDPWKVNGTGAAFESYVAWIKESSSHAALFEAAADETQDDPERAFKWLFKSMSAVNSFGRTARFDYLSMIGKLELANIQPDSVHFGSATGPLDGARLLFCASTQVDVSAKQLEMLADQLATFLRIDKQVMEDSLCNWQKSPNSPVRFRG